MGKNTVRKKNSELKKFRLLFDNDSKDFFHIFLAFCFYVNLILLKRNFSLTHERGTEWNKDLNYAKKSLKFNACVECGNHMRN